MVILRKNVAGQFFYVKLTSATDGSAITIGSPTVNVEKDGAGQGAIGGSIAHVANGKWRVTLAQADTNGDFLGFDIAVSGAVAVAASFRTVGFDPGVVNLPANLTQWKGSAPADLIDTDKVQASAQHIANNLITAAAIADGALTAAKFAAGAFDAVWSVATRTLTAFDASFKTGYALSAAGIQAIWDALTSALTTAGSIGKLLVDNLNATVSSRATQTTADAIEADTQDIQSRLPAALVGGRMSSDAVAISGSTAAADAVEANIGNLDAAISTRATPAQVNAEVVDALAVDTYPEPPQGTPPATTTLANKIGYPYKSWRNKKDNDGSETKLYAANGTTVDQKQATSEAAGVVTKDSWVTGP
jgi:hypothetical protein